MYKWRSRFACLVLAAFVSVALVLFTWSFFGGRSPHLREIKQWVLPDEQSVASRLRSRFGNTSRASFDARLYSFNASGGELASRASGGQRRPQRPLVRLVHQSWKRTQLPKRMAAWSRTWRDCFPDWTHVLWTDEDNERFVRDEYAWFLPRYQSFTKHIYRVDAVRYLYLHRFGGIYTVTYTHPHRLLHCIIQLRKIRIPRFYRTSTTCVCARSATCWTAASWFSETWNPTTST